MLSFTTSTVLVTLLSIVNGAPSAAALGPAGVNLRTAGNYAILSKAGVSTVSPSSINADIHLALSQHPRKLLASFLTPATLTVAIGDMETAFTDANGRINPDFSDLASGALGGLVLTPGLYKWAGAVSAASDFTISGTSTDTWIFQVAGTLDIAAGKKAILAGGARKVNIVWVVSGAVTVADGAHLEGVILGKTSVSLTIGASLNGRILAQTSAALQTATVVS
ncbi:antifreeze protein [Mycena rebaudengoi]|nr:antifreeze protein [Mycena rebaudengoi]